MNIGWVAYGHFESADGKLTSRLASQRYRMLIPAQALAAIGERSAIVRLDAPGSVESLYRAGASDLLVVGKLLPDVQQGLFPRVKELIALARADRKAVLVDICDDHFSHEYYRELARLGERVVVPTEKMRELVLRHTDHPCAVVPDPAEGEQGVARIYRASERRELRLLWYGARNNLPALIEALPQLVVGDARAELEILSDGGPQLDLVCEQWNARGGRALWLQATAWSLEEMRRALEDCDAIVLPSAIDDPRKIVKSSNRLVEGLQAGRLVLAHPLPAYEEFSPYAWISQDLAQGLRWMLASPEEALSRVIAGQGYVREKFSARAIALRWQKVLTDALEAKRGA